MTAANAFPTLSRRGFLGAILAAGTAPAILRLPVMPLRVLEVPWIRLRGGPRDMVAGDQLRFLGAPGNEVAPFDMLTATALMTLTVHGLRYADGQFELTDDKGRPFLGGAAMHSRAVFSFRGSDGRPL